MSAIRLIGHLGEAFSVWVDLTLLLSVTRLSKMAEHIEDLVEVSVAAMSEDEVAALLGQIAGDSASER